MHDDCRRYKMYWLFFDIQVICATHLFSHETVLNHSSLLHKSLHFLPVILTRSLHFFSERKHATASE